VLQGVALVLQFLQLDESAPKETKKPIPIYPMNSFIQLLAAMAFAAAFGIAAVQIAATEPMQQHSGTQRYVRVVR
jgi:hypothetical protein